MLFAILTVVRVARLRKSLGDDTAPLVFDLAV
jgi:hypothetical protein